MINFRPIFYTLGLLLCILAIALFIPALVDLSAHNPDWKVFVTTSFLTLFAGGILVLTNKTSVQKIEVRQAFILTSLAWVSIAGFGALPFVFSGLEMTYIDAFFEATSGITTTGSTVIEHLSKASPGILLWRSLLQWLGGIGIVVMAVSVMPFLQVGGMQFFQMEFSAKAEKVLPRTSQISIGIAIVYIMLTAVCAIALTFAGMSEFEAINHAMTTMSTGGYSTHDASVGAFNTPAVDYIIALFMVLASLPFIQYLRALKGNPLSLFKDAQVQAFLAIIAVSIVLIVYTLNKSGLYTGEETLRHSIFNTISLLTGTGFATADYNLWGGFAITLLTSLMLVGGCAGSTTCGMKIFRLQILMANTVTQFKRLLEPHGVFLPYYEKKPISEELTMSVLSFFFLYILILAVLTILLSLTGLDFITAFSGAATAVANVGPGVGEIIGPTGNFASLNDAAKIFLSIGMFLGRLELLTILVLFTPAFWRD